MAPESIKVRKSSRCVEFTFDGDTTALSFEFLRVYSPSAEVRGHGIGNGVLQTGKKDVVLLQMEPSGNYALKLVFDDGHDSGLYDWKYLRHLCRNREALWQEYLDNLQQAGASRETGLINFKSL
ncbi:MAG: 1-(5-phosphoribosyl)-5-((5-phosphoribosylamino)methylideneamino)imidazole-4-carboxamide isomerase [Oceanospirillaceae bacterium]|nr:1-(5-phosphoribosyl)-5-((5-phosphoribosylamino)methylideneamino)imidazole-4-carboxamide isomerase [Oceanospirillaceae bacterium]|tara:strand:- start:357 stop:728 length:372 start_codon:yes stop_codon:yes gene_type:complete